MIGVITVKVSAHSPQMPLCPAFAFKGSPSSLRIESVPKNIGNWNITNIYASFHYPDDTLITKEAARVGNVWVATVDGCQMAGKVQNGLQILANGIDEDGNEVSGYILGAGDIYIMEGDSIVPDPTTVKNYVKLCDTMPDAPSTGDAYFQNGVLVIYDGTQWKPAAEVSTPSFIIDENGNRIDADRSTTYVSGYTPWQMEQFYTATFDPPVSMPFQTIVIDGEQMNCWITSDAVQLPPGMFPNYVAINEGMTNIYLLTKEGDTYHNDGGDLEITEKSDVEITNTDQVNVRFTRTKNYGTGELALVADVPTKTSDLTNDSGFITSEEVQPYLSWQSQNTGLAHEAMFLGTTDEMHRYDQSGYINGEVNFKSQNVDPYITLTGTYTGCWPWTLTQFFGTTYSPALELVWWKGAFNRLRAGRYSETYYGYMWRTKGIGFAIPCSEDGIPDGRLFEITKVEQTYPYRISNTGNENHTITGNEAWTSIETIDGQTNQIACTRAVILKNKVYETSFARQDDLPTKTSELTNDSGYITAQQVPTPSYIQDASGNRIEADLDYLSYDYTAPWTANNDFGDLTWDSDYNYWSGIDEYDTTKLVLSWNEGSNQWELQIFDWVAGDWEHNSTETKSGTYEDITVAFQTYTCTRTVAVRDKLATEGYVDNIVGDINSALDAINGEVI